MPRHSDPQLEGRILSTADRLFQRGGEKALTMRAVARAAGTTTPTLYQRFRNREEILRVLVQRSQQRLVEEIRPSRSLGELCQRVLAYCLTNPHDYDLLSSGLIAKLNQPRPTLRLALQKTAEWYGGLPEDHYPLILALWSLLQGAIVLFESLPKREAPVIQASFITAVRILIRERQAFAPR